MVKLTQKKTKIPSICVGIYHDPRLVLKNGTAAGHSFEFVAGESIPDDFKGHKKVSEFEVPKEFKREALKLLNGGGKHLGHIYYHSSKLYGNRLTGMHNLGPSDNSMTAESYFPKGDKTNTAFEGKLIGLPCWIDEACIKHLKSLNITHLSTDPDPAPPLIRQVVEHYKLPIGEIIPIDTWLERTQKAKKGVIEYRKKHGLV